MCIVYNGVMNINANVSLLKDMFDQKKVEGKTRNKAAEFLGIDPNSVSRHISSDDLSIQTLF